MNELNIGDIVVYISNIKYIIQDSSNNLYINNNIDRYKIIECDEKHSKLYYHVINIKTNNGYYVLKTEVRKIV